jgi:P27 family predicted phage terminase small subunit
MARKQAPIAPTQWEDAKRKKPATLQAPPELDADGRAEWDRIIGQLNAEGRIANLDLGSLTVYCQAFARYLQCERVLQRDGLTYMLLDKNGNPRFEIQRPQVAIGNKAAAQVTKLAAELGLSPAGRARMSTKTGGNMPQKRDNPNSKRVKDNVVNINDKYFGGGG